MYTKLDYTVYILLNLLSSYQLLFKYPLPPTLFND